MLGAAVSALRSGHRSRRRVVAGDGPQWRRDHSGRDNAAGVGDGWSERVARDCRDRSTSGGARGRSGRRVRGAGGTAASARHPSGRGDRRRAVRRHRRACRRQHARVAGRRSRRRVADGVVGRVERHRRRRSRGRLRHRAPVRHATAQRIEPQLPQRSDDPQHRGDAARRRAERCACTRTARRI